MEFKTRLKQLREEKRYTHSQVAAILGKSEGAIRSWEMGRSTPDFNVLIELAKHFNVTTDFILGMSEYKSDEEKQNTIRISHETALAVSTLPPEIINKINSIIYSAMNCYRYLKDVDRSGLGNHAIWLLDVIATTFDNQCEGVAILYNYGVDPGFVSRFDIIEEFGSLINDMHEWIANFMRELMVVSLGLINDYTETEEMPLIEKLRSIKQEKQKDGSDNESHETE